jgi:hypothetical protein
MNTVGRSAMIAESRFSKELAANDDFAANEEEVEEQIEEQNVEKTARENETGAPITMVSNEERAVDDDAASAGEEVQQQIERKRVEKEAFENRISAASAEKWIRNGRTHD